MDTLNSSCWVDKNACAALCQLVLEDRRGGSTAGIRRPRLPPVLWSQHVAPFLRFEGPLPNMLYVFGGRNRQLGPVDSVEMLDTWNGQWVQCPDMPVRRAGSAAAALPDGRMLVVGGYDERGIAEGLLSTCDLYNPVTECWEKGGAAPLLRARWGHGCAVLGGKVYAVGGCSLRAHAQSRDASMETLRSCEVYDPELNAWESCASLKIGRSGARLVNLGDSRLAAVGGCDDVFGRAETQATVELFDVTAKCWTLLDLRLSEPRTSAAISAIDDTHIFVAGGAPSRATAEVYQVPLPNDQEDEAEKTFDHENFAAVIEMADGRMGCQAAMISLPRKGSDYPQTENRCVLVIGGERCDEVGEHPLPRVKQLSSVAAFDLDAGVWREESVVPSMSIPRTTVALCSGSGRVASARLK